MIGSITLPAGAENGAFLLLDLVRRPDEFEAQIKKFADARAQLAAEQAKLDKTQAEIATGAKENAGSLALIREETAALDGKKKATLAKLEQQAAQTADLERREKALAEADQAHYKNVADERAALDARSRQLDDREAGLVERENVLADREAKAAALIAQLETKNEQLRAIVG